MHPLIWKKCSLRCLDIFLISNIQNTGINRLFLLHLSFNFTICPIFICIFIFLLIVFHIPLCKVRQPYKGCPLTCFLAEITWNETAWRMRTNNVKRVYSFSYMKKHVTLAMNIVVVHIVILITSSPSGTGFYVMRWVKYGGWRYRKILR